MKKLEFNDLTVFYGNKEEIKKEAKKVSKRAEKEFSILFVIDGNGKKLYVIESDDKRADKIKINAQLLSDALSETTEDMTEDICVTRGFQLAEIMNTIEKELGL